MTERQKDRKLLKVYQKINTGCKQCAPQSHPLHLTKFIVKLRRCWMTEKGSVYREGIVGNELGCTEKDLQRSRLIDGENLI